MSKFFSKSKFRTVLFAFLFCFAAPSIAHAGGQVPFRASYNLELVADIVGPIATVTSEGSALVSHLGAVRANSISETVNLATGVGIAVHQFTAANGDTIRIGFQFLALPTPAGFEVSGEWEILSGTGRFTGATGSGSYSGDVAFTSPVTALGTFELLGTISSPGSLKK
ncbi:MAG TPA: hypothetical protein VF773_19055 [Verrucomicrobiae bacterium]